MVLCKKMLIHNITPLFLMENDLFTCIFCNLVFVYVVNRSGQIPALKLRSTWPLRSLVKGSHVMENSFAGGTSLTYMLVILSKRRC